MVRLNLEYIIEIEGIIKTYFYNIREIIQVK